MHKFNVGDIVVVNLLTLGQNDTYMLGTNSTMIENGKLRIRLRVEHVTRHGYILSDSYTYKEQWLTLVKSKVVKSYHKDPKLNAVIIKMKSLEIKFNTRRSLDESTLF